MEISISVAVAQTFCLESEGEQRHKGHISAMRCWQRVPPIIIILWQYNPVIARCEL